MKRTIWRACGIALLGSLGFGSAYTLAGSATAAIPTTTITLPTVTAPTVTVPTLPVTTTVTLPTLPTTTTVTVPPPPVTLPPPPPVTVPSLPVSTPSVPNVPPPSAPLPKASAPAVPAPNLPGQGSASARPTAGGAGPAAPASTTPSAPGAPSDGGSGYTTPAQVASSTAERASGFAGPARLSVSRNRFTNRGKKRGLTVLRFRLSRAAKLILVVRGPGPSCAIAGRVAFRGREGVNRFRFNGRIAGRPLEPGTYQLTLRPRARKTKLGRAVVTIVAPGATATTRIPPQCTTPQPAPEAFVSGAGTFEGRAAGDPGSTDPQAAPTAQITGDEFSDREQPPLAVLPGLQFIDEPHELPIVLGLAVLALLLVSLVGILVEVVRHLRSSHA